ncbi:acetyl-CoA C-acyltransferase [Subtercola endophyticus]|uniref:acetyl-CoA C-acyltransferase n=1 Tax=Subtercola endophyticus TaxID=2895559 RepID=UPI001E57AC65|nr:acetyl-CoA C-acyltransferase [Subtercola endophyticus]UFS58130.1 acetyl-CoA C-acyltransferase [Subtercola endophyticus]
MATSVIVSGARTPIGKLLGALSTLTAPELGGIAIRAAIERSGVPIDAFDAAFLGNVVQAGVGPNPARLAAVAGGLPLDVPATTINKLCLSGLTAVATADAFIRAGQYRTVLAGGFESMSNAPYLERGVRAGLKYGRADLEDALDRDALICGIDGDIMGLATEKYQRPFHFTRTQLDEFAALSHTRASAARVDGRFEDELVPVEITTRAGVTDVVDDEGVRPATTVESLSKLRPAFLPDGTITAGSSSQLSDGGAALVVMQKAEAERQGLEWLAEIVSYGSVGGPDPSLVVQPAGAIENALAHAAELGAGSLSAADLDLIEINEAFAGVALGSMKQLKVDPDIVNVNGGAIALGHPVGMSGARLVLTLALELKRRGGGLGAAALCGGGGQGDALIIRVP